MLGDQLLLGGTDVEGAPQVVARVDVVVLVADPADVLNGEVADLINGIEENIVIVIEPHPCTKCQVAWFGGKMRFG